MATTSAYTSLVLKGTRHGLLASIREDADWSIVISELNSLSSGGEGFLTDASLTFDFGWREVTESQFDQVITALHSQGLTCNGILSTSLNTRTIAEERGYRAIIGRLGLAKHQGRRLRRQKPESEEIKVADVPHTVLQTRSSPDLSDTGDGRPLESFRASTADRDHDADRVHAEPATPSGEVEDDFEEPSQEAPRYQDEEPTLYLRKTLRSGQKVVFAGNVVLLGDLNPGAQIEADGDVIVMGNLRGTVHAGAEGDRSSSVITSSLKPTQLRIADRFWVAEKTNSFFKKSTNTGTLKARLDGDSVVVEALSTR